MSQTKLHKWQKLVAQHLLAQFQLKNLNIYGFKVYGGIEEIELIYENLKFEKVVIACEDLNPENLEKLKKFCAGKEIVLKKFICTEQ